MTLNERYISFTVRIRSLMMLYQL